MAKGYRRTNFSTPKKGTKKRAATILMLRPQGVSFRELHDLGLTTRESNLGPMLEYLKNESGFDIRTIAKRKSEHGTKPNYVYRIVGRYKWEGGYRSFVSSEE